MDQEGKKNNTKRDAPCRIAEVLQYTCNVGEDADGRPQMHCFEIPRIFKLCRGYPALEITTLVDIDSATGEVAIPADTSSENLVVRATWKDVIRYKNDDSTES